MSKLIDINGLSRFKDKVIDLLSNKADKTDTVLLSTLSRGRLENTTIGERSFAFGGNVTATGDDSHAEGRRTIASGDGSHAEGSATVASGYYSHAEGYGSTANHLAQSVSGEYNIADTSNATNDGRGTYVRIVGNGTGDSNRSNAYALEWGGTGRFGGNLYTNCSTDSSGGNKVATELYVSNAIEGAKGLIYIGTCSTGDATAAKTVVCADFDQLATGATIHVKFTYSNTSANPTLNVNNTGAKSISMSTPWQAGDVVPFVYDGTNWCMSGSGGIDTSALAPKASPIFTGSVTLGSTTMTEQNLVDMLDILANIQTAVGVSF